MRAIGFTERLTMPTSSTRYTGTAIALHWLLALAILGSFVVGLYMTELPMSPQRLKLYNWHKWAGIVILTLSAIRLLWRLAHRPPADVPMPDWQRKTSHAVHIALYVLFFAVPLAGWAYSSAAGFPVVVFGVIPLPDFVAPDKEFAEAIKPFAQDPRLQHGRAGARPCGGGLQTPLRRPRRPARAHASRPRLNTTPRP